MFLWYISLFQLRWESPIFCKMQIKQQQQQQPKNNKQKKKPKKQKNQTKDKGQKTNKHFTTGETWWRSFTAQTICQILQPYISNGVTSILQQDRKQFIQLNQLFQTYYMYTPTIHEYFISRSLLCSSPSYSPRTVNMRTRFLVHAPRPAPGMEEVSIEKPGGVVSFARCCSSKSKGSLN